MAERKSSIGTWLALGGMALVLWPVLGWFDAKDADISIFGYIGLMYPKTCFAVGVPSLAIGLYLTRKEWR